MAARISSTAVFALAVLVAGSSARAQYAQGFPRVLLPCELAVCRVDVSDSDGSMSRGSGVAIQPPATHARRFFVLTAYHVIRSRASGRSCRVSWDGERHFECTIAAARPACDSALLEVHGAPSSIPRIDMATEEIVPGEPAFAFGFGGDDRLRCTGGKVTELVANNQADGVWFEFAGHFRQGDSGGPVFVVRDGKPQVIGCAWGTGYDSGLGYHTVVACRLRVLNRLFGIEKAPAYALRPGGNVSYGNIYGAGGS